jgi:hypothetical protein
MGDAGNLHRGVDRLRTRRAKEDSRTLKRRQLGDLGRQFFSRRVGEGVKGVIGGELLCLRGDCVGNSSRPWPTLTYQSDAMPSM